MIGLIQRVRRASVHVDDELVGDIGQGLLALIGIEKDDDEAKADRLLQRILGYRIFADEADKMNLSLRDISGELLLVSQFTLAADTRKGARPSFSSAMPPAQAKELFDYLLSRAKETDLNIASGRFGADMQVSLLNDGPVTFSLRV